MIKIIADNILSPLGETTESNLKAVRSGASALKKHQLEGMPEPFVGSLIEPHLDFEQGLIRTIAASLAQTNVDARDESVIFIISSTKGNVADFEPIGTSAVKVARHFGNPNRPIVVSNACISGLSAQILAMRLLRAGHYQTAVVAGMDVQGKFIVSGFQSFKALSPDECRPFDGDRCGLNLGEAAASLILTRNEKSETLNDELEISNKKSEIRKEEWRLEEGCVRNDANHISNPSRTGEGCLRAIRQVLNEGEQPVCISAHGTATLYNDEMEACAIDHAGLAEVPTFSLKGYYGHTMGAAGILETIVTLHALSEGWIPATRGFAEAGTSHEINVTSTELPVHNGRVLKLLSGFGGCNGALVFVRGESVTPGISGLSEMSGSSGKTGNSGSSGVLLTPADAPEGLTALYKQWVGDYPKFYKMDPLCKLGFLASEALTKASQPTDWDRTAIVIFTRLGSMAIDRAYTETIRNEEDYFPSPSMFVYTLSNIVTGEIAIRHQCHGETSCYILDEKDWPLMECVVQTTFQDPGIDNVLGGWLDYEDDRHFEADLRLWRK